MNYCRINFKKYKKIFICLILCACIANKKSGKYILEKKEFKFENKLLRTDGVYLHKYDVNGNSYYSFLRFYEDGKCYEVSNLKGTPSNDMLMSTKHFEGEMCYYNIKDRNLIYEHWAGGYVGYCYVYGKVKSDKIIIAKYKPRGWFSTSHDLPPTEYIFKKL